MRVLQQQISNSSSRHKSRAKLLIPIRPTAMPRRALGPGHPGMYVKHRPRKLVSAQHKDALALTAAACAGAPPNAAQQCKGVAVKKDLMAVA